MPAGIRAAAARGSPSRVRPAGRSAPHPAGGRGRRPQRGPGGAVSPLAALPALRAAVADRPQCVHAAPRHLPAGAHDLRARGLPEERRPPTADRVSGALPHVVRGRAPRRLPVGRVPARWRVVSRNAAARRARRRGARGRRAAVVRRVQAPAAVVAGVRRGGQAVPPSAMPGTAPAHRQVVGVQADADDAHPRGEQLVVSGAELRAVDPVARWAAGAGGRRRMGCDLGIPGDRGDPRHAAEDEPGPQGPADPRG